MRELLRGLADLLLPPACAACGAPADDPLCAPCAGRLPRIPRDHCTLCQQLLATVAPPDRAWGARCFACAPRRGPLRGCVAGCWYEGDAATWIRAYKYPRRPRGLGDDARALWLALARETLAQAPPVAPDALVPVPLHRRRLRGRGFNPALTLARQLAHLLTSRQGAAAVEPRLLARLRDTPHQTGLSQRARRRNVRGAFGALRPAPARVWLVDDVVTTGATLWEAARVLRRAGAREVVALCAARTPAPDGAP